MRSFGLIALLVVLVIVGWLGTRQVARVPAPALPASGAASAQGNVAEQSRQIQQQIRQQVESTLQAPRDLPDDAK
ncbi:MAG: hypothetical protein QM772_01195 [Ottowia sp.]|uniref:hypothetical protein n=1 Tax=Ottowia sp. TaxID=1898956 RepID=UPI0039E51B9C